MHDWANSVYQLTIVSAIFPIYYNTVIRTGNDFTVSFFDNLLINMMMGLLTTLFMAVTYGEKQLGLKEDMLIPTILVIQLIGMFGVWSFSRLSGRICNLKALMITVVIWILVCFGTLYVTNAIGFVVVAGVVGIVMGGSQSLCAVLIPKCSPKTPPIMAIALFFILSIVFFAILLGQKDQLRT